MIPAGEDDLRDMADLVVACRWTSGLTELIELKRDLGAETAPGTGRLL